MARPAGWSSSRMEIRRVSLLSSKIDNMSVKAGTVIRDLCPCGGGFGQPELRSQDSRDRDRADHLVTK